MKKLFVIVLFSCMSSFSQNISFTDLNLKGLLLSANTTTNLYAQNSIGQWITIDTNNNGEIQVSEALQVSYLQSTNGFWTNPIYWPIASINDLNAFKNLVSLYCDEKPLLTSVTLSNLPFLEYLELGLNSLVSINLSNLPSIVGLGFSINLITNINLSSLPTLKYIGCSNNPLTNLNLSNNLMLEAINCFNCQFTSLDFSQLPNFKVLYCKNNPNLTSINIKNGRVHYYDTSLPIDSVDWKEGNTNLTSICVDSNEQLIVQTLLNNDITNILPNLVVSSTCNFLETAAFKDEEFQVSPNPSNGIFNITFNSLLTNETQIEVYNLLSQKMFATTISQTDNYPLSLANLPTGTYLLKISDNDQTTTQKLIKN